MPKNTPTDASVVEARRTPHGRILGALADVSAVDLGTTSVEALLEGAEVEPDDVDWVGMGNAISAGLGQVPARQVTVRSRLPDITHATTVNEASGSGLRAITTAVNKIDSGRSEVAVAGGMESMTNAPYLLHDLRKGRRHGDTELVDSMVKDALWDMNLDSHMGELTEELVDEHGISREEQDRYALRSHSRALEAVESGVFDPEVVAVEVDGEAVERDEGPRDTSMEKLGKLRPAFREDGSITAGNASDLSDGAGCALVVHRDRAEDVTDEAVYDVVDHATSYRNPRWFGLSVTDVVDSLLTSNDLSVDDVDVFEINEAFAATMVHFQREIEVPDDKLNVRGGAIALGHPIGASGGMLTTSLLHTMREHGHEIGVVGMSIGGGGGIAMLIRRR